MNSSDISVANPPFTKKTSSSSVNVKAIYLSQIINFELDKHKFAMICILSFWSTPHDQYHVYVVTIQYTLRTIYGVHVE